MFRFAISTHGFTYSQRRVSRSFQLSKDETIFTPFLPLIFQVGVLKKYVTPLKLVGVG
jgi:hypothetical protein